MGTVLSLLVPRDESNPEFRREVERLSLQGLRIIAVVGFGANLLSYVLLVPWIPSIPAWMPASDAVSFAILFLVLGLTWWPAFRPHARWACLVVLFIAFAGQMLTAFGQSEIPFDPRTMGPAVTSICLLLAVTALPVKPLQVLALGSSLGTAFFLSSYGPTRYRDLSFEDALPVSILIISLLIATALTAIVYRQRADAFHARRSAEQALAALKDAQGRLLISENAASQNRFAAALCHELNTPLGALSSVLDTLVAAHRKLDPNSGDRIRGVIADAEGAGRRSIQRLEQTIERMKHIVNLDRAEVQVVDLNELWRDTVGLMDDELAPRVTFVLELSSIPTITCRPQQLAAVFANLVQNAAAAIDGHGTIHIRTTRRDSEILVEVEDDGRGIPKGVLPGLFEPAFRAEGGRITTANWGLFVSRGVVTEHGGHIEIESEVGMGTTVRIRLPVAG